MRSLRLALITIVLSPAVARAQSLGFTATRAEVDFSKKLRDWDGFGINYVETAQTKDPSSDPQDYGGFSILPEERRREIIDRVFGDDGLRVGLVKMFLDPFHRASADAPFDHARTTGRMVDFVRRGLDVTRARGGDLTIITTLYGPPAYVTKQGIVRGRDLDPARADALAAYFVDWARYLKREQKLPLRFVSLHNEGEDWRRWKPDGAQAEGDGHDHNMFWSPDQVVDFLKRLPPALRKAGLSDVGVTPGETFSWDKMFHWGYADRIADDRAAVKNLALVTSHGFLTGGFGRWHANPTSAPVDRLREAKPSLHAWVTSTSWGKMNVDFARELHRAIYEVKVNGIIPWAALQRPGLWKGGDPNPGCAFVVHEDGRYEVQRGYDLYKPFSRAGQPGMSVVRAFALDSEVAVAGFGANGTRNPDAFVVVNSGKAARPLAVRIRGTRARAFTAFRTNDAGGAADDRYRPVGRIALGEGDAGLAGDELRYEAPPRSVSVFFAAR